MAIDGNDVEFLETGNSLAEREHQQGFEGQEHVKSSETLTSIAALQSAIADDILTDGVKFSTFVSPFESPEGALNPSGGRYLEVPLVYCDQTASSRAVKSIEKYIEKVCLPWYGNTHTNTSVTGSQSTAFVAEARQIVAEETNAKITGKASLDVVLFAGQGTTSAVELLIDCLGLRHACSDVDKRPVVFIGPYEHHSNLIPWRESGCEVVMVPENVETQSVDYLALERLLQLPRFMNRMKMGTFSAASNVTGRVSDCDRIAAILHTHNALAFFDYATGAPYMSMNMNPPPCERYPLPSLIAKDAMFLSPHKMLGGVGTPGVLIVKKHLVSQVNAPNRSGGGTVFYVTNASHRFLSNRIERYEGGTPHIVGIIRVGLAFLLKRKAEQKYKLLAKREGGVPQSIYEMDCLTHERVTAYLKIHAPNIIILGDSKSDNKSLPIFSFLIRFGRRFLHYNYVCAVLNDVFGIQSRGGCQCSGPYSQRLLGLTLMTGDVEVPNGANESIEKALLQYKERAELLRPGYTRLSLPFKGMHQEEIDYVLRALVWVAKNGWALMCQYRCNHRTGEWRHYSRQGRPLGRAERRWLTHYDFENASPYSCAMSAVHNSTLKDALDMAFRNADCLLQTAKNDQSAIQQGLKMTDAQIVLGDDGELEALRWYVYPRECAQLLSNATYNVAEYTSLDDPLGALDPVRFNGTSVEREHSPGQTFYDDNRKRKPPNNSGANENLNESSQIDFSEIVYFRDGDIHSGEASLREVEEGIEDGELSARCEIYVKDVGLWMSFESFIRSTKKTKKSILGSSQFDDHQQKGIHSDSMEIDSSPLLCLRKKESIDQPSVNKKAARDTCTWGHGELTVEGHSAEYDHHQIEHSLNVNWTRAEKDTQAKGFIIPSSKTKRIKHVKPPSKLMRYVTQAVMQWDMLQDGDRLLLGLSGGKDSLTLLHCLLELQRKLPTKFEVEVCTIDPMTPSFDPSPLIPYIESLGLKYHYIRDDIVSRASSSGRDGKVVSSLCAFCARMKRGNLYTCARQNNCNKLVLAQHLDDCAESLMMSIMHNGFLRTMKANYKINAGDISVIRPLVYCRESLTTDFAKSSNLPVINENCPACFEEPKERARIKKMLSREENLYPNFYDNIRRSLIPLMHDDLTAILHCYTEEAVAKSRKKIYPKGNKRDNYVDTGIIGKPEAEMTSELGVSAHQLALSEASEEQLAIELARKKANRYRLAGALATDARSQVPLIDKVCTAEGGCSLFD